MQALIEAIQSAFAANGTLTAAFPGGLWGDAAPEAVAMPYVVQRVLGAPVTSCYGTAKRLLVAVQFTAYGPGRDAMLGKAETLAAAFRDVTLTVAGGQNYDSRQTTDPVPVREGRDASAADDPAQGDVYGVSVVFEFAVRTA